MAEAPVECETRYLVSPKEARSALQFAIGKPIQIIAAYVPASFANIKLVCGPERIAQIIIGNLSAIEPITVNVPEESQETFHTLYDHQMVEPSGYLRHANFIHIRSKLEDTGRCAMTIKSKLSDPEMTKFVERIPQERRKRFKDEVKAKLEYELPVPESVHRHFMTWGTWLEKTKYRMSKAGEWTLHVMHRNSKNVLMGDIGIFEYESAENFGMPEQIPPFVARTKPLTRMSSRKLAGMDDNSFSDKYLRSI